MDRHKVKKGEGLENPLVSICCKTYNHEKFLRKTLKGFINQNSTYPIEIIIYDDASTDSSVSIIKEYSNKYPDYFKTIFQKENQWSIIKGGIYPRLVFPHAKGKYIALCEGDDYWTDPNKIQDQIDFLENNKEFTLTSGGYIQKTNSGKTKKVVKSNQINKSDKYGFPFTVKDTLNVWLTKTLTVCFKKDSINDLKLSPFEKFRDTHLYYHILRQGKGFYFNRVFGYYRIHKNGIYSGADMIEKLKLSRDSYSDLYNYYGDEILKRKCFNETFIYLLNVLQRRGVIEYYRTLFKYKSSLLSTVDSIKNLIKLTYLVLPILKSYPLKRGGTKDN